MAWKVGRRAAVYGLLGLCLLIVAAGLGWRATLSRPPLLLAPMMGLTPCWLAQASATTGPSDWRTGCTGPKASAAHLIESTLQRLQPTPPAVSGGLQLGYTLQVPLLALLQPVGDTWQVDQQAIEKIVRTVVDTPRPAVLYLFSTHFGVNAPIEPELARDPANLAQTARGPLAIDTYYSQPIYPWSLARTDNSITQYRAKVIGALTEKICELPSSARRRIQGITVLGEVHHLFPNFESGMGFDSPYQVSDYSAVSVMAFRQYLQDRYASIKALNQELGSAYASFAEVAPPSKDIRKEPLRRYHEHMDAYAAGQLPITGWVHAPHTSEAKPVVRIYLNGTPIADAPVHLSRQDVRAAHPEFNTADLGWRHDLDYSQLQPGIHRIDLALLQSGQPLVNLGTRTISILDQRQSAPAKVPEAAPLPLLQVQPAHITAYTDDPRDQADYYYNPLAREWQAFRETQVVSYLQYFNTLIAKSCLSDTLRYTHQIVPQFNPGWDGGKYAVNASLEPMTNLHAGISLYGETSYGRSFLDWFKLSPRGHYGITEFHPLQPMSPQQLGAVLDQHRQSGARFLSFFLETRFEEQRVLTLPNPFSFDPDNRQHASDQLYTSMRALLAK